jgi:anti-sigma B factor antagonist
VHDGSVAVDGAKREVRAPMSNGLGGDRTSHPSDGSQFEVVDATDVDAHAVVVRVVGDLDLITAPRLATHLRRQIESRPDGTAVVVDLDECGFLGSKGVAALMTAAEDAAARGCTLSIIGCRPIVLRVLDITGVRDALNVTPA